MTRLRHLLCAAGLLAGVTFVAGCPTPPDSTTPQQGGGPNGGQPGGPGGQAGAGGGQPGGAGGPGGPGGQAGAGGGQPGGGQPGGAGGPGVGQPGAGMPGGAPPSFAALIGDGPTVTVTVTVTGLDDGQIDFQTLDEQDGHKMPRVLHVQPVTGAGPHEVTAPASYDGEIYVSAMKKMDTPPGEGGPKEGLEKTTGGLAQPIKLDGKDLELSLAIGTVPAWLDELMQPMGEPPEGGGPGGPPPEGGGKGGPPPGAPGGPDAKDAPAGPPPEGGAAPGTPPAGGGEKAPE